MQHLTISLLGTLQIALNGKPAVGFYYDKMRALLVYLIMEQSSEHRRETLAEMWWPDQPEKAGRDSLRAALYSLRQAIGDPDADPPFLLVARDTLQFNADSNFSLDTTDFIKLIDKCEKHSHAQIENCTICIQHLQEAIEFYRGPFAERLVIDESDAFREWVDFQRDYFQSRVLDALNAVTEFHLRRHSYDLARRYAWRQVELVPWHESAYRQLMRALALSGQRTAALAQYERCCRVLEEELAISPAAETTALYEEIRASGLVPIQQSGTTPERTDNLPLPSTSFIGRDTELTKILQRITDSECHLLTVVGAGGIGKTRLALEAARRSNGLFEGIHFVPLTSVDAPELLGVIIADVLNFSTVNVEDFSAQLINYLSDKRLLLILDNMENIVAGATLLSQIVARAPDVKLLVTSRVRLNLQGEWVFDLKGLSVDKENQSAIQLFVQRAQMAQADFAVSDVQISTIARICQLVDGMPLGIELAAAWVQMLSCGEIADSIANNLTFLTAKTRDLPERHQSLRAVFESSWNLLSTEEQHVFRSLAVFRGGFQADVALEICGAALPLLLTFTNKSMLHRNAQGRYEVHELLRQFALEKLHQAGEAESIFNLHLQYFVDLVETAELLLRGGQQILWLERLEAENDNLRSALDWSLTNHKADLGLRLAGSLWFFWHIRHYASEGLAWLEKLLAAAPDAASLIRTKALFAAGWLAQSNRDLFRAAVLSQESLQLARQIANKHSIAYPLSTLAWLTYFQGQYEQASTLGEESLALFREAKDRWGIVHTLNILGYIAESQADYARAELFQREGMVIARNAGDNDSLAWSMYLLGRVMAERGQYHQAIELCNQALEIYREVRNNWGIAIVLYTLGFSSLSIGNFSQAALLCEESIKLLRELSDFWAIGGPLSCLGLVAYRQGDLMLAHALSQESLIYFRQFGDKRGMAFALNTLGIVANHQGNFETARTFLQESLSLRRDAGIRSGMEVCFEQLAEIAATKGDLYRAARLFGAAVGLQEQLSVAPLEIDLVRYQNAVAVVQSQFESPIFNALWMEGKTQPLESIIAYALEGSHFAAPLAPARNS
ncbi:MAG: tetratricopeptide repeat protein [Anaerolineae bacterium]|nr:tetratricopeptide repeat protein [Anaerolineae bacterium]